MTLREIIYSNPHLFYSQSWYNGEDFLEVEAKEMPLPDFEQWSFAYLFPRQDAQRVNAADLALCYVKNPDAKIWTQYIWCNDLDSQKQRVYVGGTDNVGLFEIHRHLSITSRWGLPKWT